MNLLNAFNNGLVRVGDFVKTHNGGVRFEIVSISSVDIVIADKHGARIIHKTSMDRYTWLGPLRPKKSEYKKEIEKPKETKSKLEMLVDRAIKESKTIKSNIILPKEDFINLALQTKDYEWLKEILCDGRYK